jgi:hypothetical protein
MARSRSLLLGCALAIAGAAGLSACNQTSATVPIVIPGVPASVNNVIAQAEATASRVCQFVPAAEYIKNIFFAGDPTLQTGFAIGNAICDALKPKAARYGGVVVAPAVVVRTRKGVVRMPVQGERL